MIGRLLVLRDRRAPRAAVIGIAALLALSLVATAPLRLAAAAFPAIAAREAEGTIWAGTLREASLGPLALGTVDVRLVPWTLLSGRPEVAVAGRADALGPALRGRLGPAGASMLEGTLAIPGGLGALPLHEVTFSGVSVQFEDGRCRQAAGAVATRLPAGDGITLALSGEPRCDGRFVLLPLRGPGGMERLDLRLAADGRWTATMVLSGIAGDMRPALAAAGFVARPGTSDLVLGTGGRF
ncbi:type II secretion system protein N [Novosphingobium huizhouense]|uniref:type II secretion system protein N n=1 Tax=Novosphingobium huizhouense TaxID=2866625 RepID=UPI001CD835E3|nr:type II secretion system protein N [Novosphingobium huizhouense]